MSLAVRRDYDGSWKVEGYAELSFSTERDAQQAAELALYYFVDRHSREMLSESVRRRKYANGQRPCAKCNTTTTTERA